MLEEDIRFPLFTRNVKGMELTEKGRLVLMHAKKIQQTIDCLSALSTQAPPIRIGLNISPDFIELFHLKKLLEQHRPNNEKRDGCPRARHRFPRTARWLSLDQNGAGQKTSGTFSANQSLGGFP